jgi:hypothetical protein
MPVPTNLSDLSTTEASNSPAGTDTIGANLDNYLRAHACILAKISAGSNALATPALGTPASGTLTNCTGLPIAGTTGYGTGVATALAVNVGSAGAFVTNGGALGTPSSGTLTNCTGLPIAGTTGYGTGVATALAVNVGSAGAFVTNGGALGTPSSGTVTNLTGTASININGTVGATTPTTGAFTTLGATGVVTVSAGAVGAPAIIPSGDTNTGVWFPAADTVAVSTAGAEAARILSTGAVLVNQTSSYSSAFGEVPRFQISQLRGASPSIPAAFYCFGNDNVGARISLGKSRGAAIGTQTIVQAGDELGGIFFCGSDGTNMNQPAASITAIVATTPGATADMPGLLRFSTSSDGSGTPTERMAIAQDGTTTIGGVSTAPAFKVAPTASQVLYLQAEAGTTGAFATLTAAGETNTSLKLQSSGTGNVGIFTGGNAQVYVTNTASANRYITLTGSNGGNPTIGVSAGTIALSAGAISTSASNGLGYGTGAGGTVTQATSKSTAVTLNKPCGQITMNNAALAGGASVTFALNNTLIATTDVVVVSINNTTGAADNYIAWVSNNNAAGSAYICIKNNTAGSLSDAVVLNFVVIKGATS